MNDVKAYGNKKTGSGRLLYRSALVVLRRLLGDAALILAGIAEDRYLKFRPALRENLVGPDFFIAGAQKSGTTSLVDWLNQVSGFRVALMKVPYKGKLRREVQFFNNPAVRIRGLRWYTSRFRIGHINGEKTPEYLYRRTSLREIHRFFPRSKMVIILRNPVDRAFSAYSHYRRTYPRSRNWDWLLPNESFNDNLMAEFRAGSHLGFLARGRYCEQLEYMYRLFPEENVKIVVFERFIADPAGVFQEIVRFLGGGDMPENIDFTAINVGKYTSRMESETRRWLYSYYRPFNERLFQLIGYRISEWDE